MYLLWMQRCFMQKYEFLTHPADLKIRAFGKTLPELFINAVIAMMDFLYNYETDNAEVLHTETIQVEADTLDNLLINWLAEILCLTDTYHQAYTILRIKQFSAQQIIAEIGALPSRRKDDIKAVTYSELAIKEKGDGWEAIFVCDI